MKFSINHTQLGAEFVIVVIGVAVALAADGWRQELSERGLEAEYLERLIAEVEIGKDRFILDREFLTDASEGASKLLATIEAKADLDREEAINNFAYAA